MGRALDDGLQPGEDPVEHLLDQQGRGRARVLFNLNGAAGNARGTQGMLGQLLALLLGESTIEGSVDGTEMQETRVSDGSR